MVNLKRNREGVGQVRKLTVKQRKFADNYIKSGNATQSAIQAGYSKKTSNVIGSENLAKPYIKKYIDDKMTEIGNSKIASAEEVLEYLTGVARGDIKETKTILVDGKYMEIQVPADLKERTKAAELLGKRYSLFTDRHEVDVSTDLSLEDFFGDK